MDKIEEGRWYRHRENTLRTVKINRLWEFSVENDKTSLGVSFMIREPGNRLDSPEGDWGRALDIKLFREKYRYDPEIPENARFELADAIEVRTQVQQEIESLIEYMPYKTNLLELLVRAVSHENACTIRDADVTQISWGMARKIDEEISPEEIAEVLG